MARIAIIGAGISGLSAAHLLSLNHDVVVYEKEMTPGGLIRCKRVNGSLYHICGGHVFNSKRKDVLDWFWSFFDKDKEFIKANRNSVVFMENGLRIPYPIENHSYMFDECIQKNIIRDWISIEKMGKESKIDNFEDFLKFRFGETLYELYFKPYNEKIWRRNLAQVPLTWLEGKLPMPTVEEMIYNNMNHIEEKKFVHSSFYYERNNGSQFIADRLSEGIDVRYDSNIENVTLKDNKWCICGEKYDKVVFCGNIKQLPSLLGDKLEGFINDINKLESHGTTSVFCEIDNNPYSWIYQPSGKHKSHRIICTGNFSPSNNSEGKMTGSIEFTDYISVDDINRDLSLMPLNPKYIDHKFNNFTYPIQDKNTRLMIKSLKDKLKTYGFYMTGRFADWEYYNMDAAIGASMDMVNANNI